MEALLYSVLLVLQKAPFNQTEEFYFEGDFMSHSQQLLNETVPVQ